MYKVFTDFDGTVTQNDVGAQLFIRFADEAKCVEAVQAWLRGDISSIEMYKRECATAQCTEKQIEKLANEQKIDPFFIEFHEKCSLKNIEISILSDGFKSYIEHILRGNNLSNMSVASNELRFDGEIPIPVFPFEAESCGKCANCKGFHVREHKSQNPDDKIIFIGDGFSDRCGAEESNIIFAKGHLAEYCDQNAMNFYRFTDFSNVIKECEKLGIIV